MLPVIKEFTISSCSEEETRDVHSSSLLIDGYAFSDVSLRMAVAMTQAEKFLTLLLKSDVNLSNHLVRKGCCGLLFGGFRSSLT